MATKKPAGASSGGFDFEKKMTQVSGDSEEAEGQRFVNGKGCTNTEINREQRSKEEHGSGDRPPERVLKLIEALDEGDQHQT